MHVCKLIAQHTAGVEEGAERYKKVQATRKPLIMKLRTLRQEKKPSKRIV